MGLIDRDRLTCIGVIAAAHGIKGEVKVTPFTNTPEYYERARMVILETPRGLAAFSVARIRTAGGHWIVALEGVEQRDGAEALQGALVLLEDSELRPLAPGEYFQHDLIGCTVETLGGEVVGRVEEIMETGANDVLVVSRGGEQVMIPMVQTVVKAVDITAKRVSIDPLPGLLEPDEEP
jgi:16S rRNA processing protein RimM